jgi:16S rRNA (cytosine1402-N4)-methyltransferase
VLDATVGGGGHADEILKRIIPGGKLIAVDKDPAAVERTKKLFEGLGEFITFINKDFRDIDGIMGSLGISEIDGALFDLGMSSFQVDEEGRGFSFLKDGPLDMRFDPRWGYSAKDVVNGASREELAGIIKSCGEERHARLVARAICDARRKKRIETTAELADIIRKAVGGKYRGQKLHPAARTFQALRIYVNDELGALQDALGGTIKHLRPGGRVCVISFHSLEDRIVKNFFRDAAKRGELDIITKKVIRPAREEIRANPRARSAKLRAAEKKT